MTVRKFVLASPELAGECMADATLWSAEKNQTKFKDTAEIGLFAISAVAEYIANVKGFTLYRDNATYPKVDKSEKI